MAVPSGLMEVIRVLLKLQDLDDLGDVALLDLARDARVEVLRKGETFAIDEHLDRHVYLIEGEMDLVADGKLMHTVTAGTERALSPLFRVRTHGLAARCVRPARLLSLDEATFERYAAMIKPRDAGITVETYLPSDSHADLIEEIRHAYYHREVDLPSMPEVAIRISQAVQSEDADFRQIATTVQADPVIAARIVQVANSAMYAGSAHVQTVQYAITRIGLEVTRAIVMSVVLRKLFTPITPLVHHRMNDYYRHSIRVAAVGHALARGLPGFDADHAFLAGLLHDIGVVPLLILADDRKELNQNPELLERVIKDLSSTVGAMLLEQWDFEPEFTIVARESEDWMREAKQADYCDIVQIAQLHCALVGGKKIDHAPPLTELPAFRRLHMDEIDPVNVIEEARQEISEIVSLLTV